MDRNHVVLTFAFGRTDPEHSNVSMICRYLHLDNVSQTYVRGGHEIRTEIDVSLRSFHDRHTTYLL